MPQEVFVDASVWCALFWPREINHRRAASLWNGVAGDQWLLCTTNWTVYEAATFLTCRVGRHDWANELLEVSKRDAKVVQAHDFETEALAIFRAHLDKAWSIVDCANFTVIRRRACRYAFAFDEHFRQAQDEFGFAVLS